MTILNETENSGVLTFAEAKAKLEAVWPDGILARHSDDPARRIPMLTVDRALVALFGFNPCGGA